MADKNITNLKSITTPAQTDELIIVTDPSGEPSNSKITIENLIGGHTFPGTTATTGFASIQGTNNGFGLKKRTITFNTADTSTSTLTLADSGSLILINGAGTYADKITLPACATTDVGVYFDFIVTTALSGTTSIKILTETAAAAGSQGFILHALKADGGSGDETTSTAFTAGGTDFLTLHASTPQGTRVTCTCVLGGTGTIWYAESIQPSGTIISVSTS